MVVQKSSAQLEQVLEETPVIAIIRADDPIIAKKTAKALLQGGITVMEIVLRTNSALDGLEALTREFPGSYIGAGTVLNEEQCKAVIARGAKFIVSPGLDEPSIAVANQAGIPIFPGIATATELQRAWNLGVRTVKFFSANTLGGPAAIKALTPVFEGTSFIPMGGINERNLRAYLDVPEVLACGGSWLTPKDAIANGDYAAITTLAKEATALARAE